MDVTLLSCAVGLLAGALFILVGVVFRLAARLDAQVGHLSMTISALTEIVAPLLEGEDAPAPDRLSILASIYARRARLNSWNGSQRSSREAVRSCRAIRDLSAAASVLERAAPPEEVRFHNE
jgi:hypothetical protein